MNKKTLILWFSALCLALLVSACGNKGPLVKPTPDKTEAGAAR